MDCKLHMLTACYPAGDRPIQITVERVWKSLDWRSKLQLMKLVAAGLAAKPPEVSLEDVAKIDSDMAVDAMAKQLTESFPQVPLLARRPEPK